MTKREMFEAIVNGTINEEIIEMAKNEIVKMDERNAKRKNSPSKASIANEPIKVNIQNYLYGVGEAKLAKEIAEAVEISTQKASALCRQLVADGTIKVEDVKVKGKGTQKAYSA